MNYVYILVRDDLPDSWKAVQACHASALLPPPPRHTPFVLLKVKDELQLAQYAQKLSTLNVDFESFHECYRDTGVTALATHPTSKREIFKDLKLL